MEQQGNRKRFILPAPLLQPYVERIWWKKVPKGIPILPFMPGTGAELLFACGTSLASVESAVPQKVPDVTLFFPRKKMIPLTATKDEYLLSVRFRTGMLHHLLPQGMVHTLPAFVSAAELWPREIPQLIEQLISTTDITQKTAIIEQFLWSLLLSYRDESPLVDTLARFLYYEHASLTVQRCADKMGYSRRQLLRICQRDFGLSPKQYLSLARFNSVLRQALLNKDSHYLAYALDAGYCDQAHFIHECKEFTDQTPQHLLRNVTEMSHFYNTSLRR